MRLAGCSSGRPERRLEDVSKSCSFIEGGYGWEADAAVYTLNCWFGHNRLEESEEKRILKCLMLYFRSSFQSAGVDVRSLVAGIGITCFQQRLHFKYEDEILLNRQGMIRDAIQIRQIFPFWNGLLLSGNMQQRHNAMLSSRNNLRRVSGFLQSTMFNSWNGHTLLKFYRGLPMQV